MRSRISTKLIFCKLSSHVRVFTLSPPPRALPLFCFHVHTFMPHGTSSPPPSLLRPYGRFFLTGCAPNRAVETVIVAYWSASPRLIACLRGVCRRSCAAVFDRGFDFFLLRVFCGSSTFVFCVVGGYSIVDFVSFAGLRKSAFGFFTIFDLFVFVVAKAGSSTANVNP